MPRIGIKGQTYINIGTRQSPIWARVKLLRDWTFELSANEVAVKNKGSFFTKYLRGLFDCPLDGEADWDPGTPFFESIQSSFFSETIVDLLILDGGIKKPDSQGMRAGFIVTKFARGEPLEDVMSVSFSLRLAADYPFEPEWVRTGNNGDIITVGVIGDDPNN